MDQVRASGNHSAAYDISAGVQTGLCSEQSQREANEDFAAVIACTRPSPLLVAAIADGIGGGKGGRVAAELAVRGFIDGCVGRALHASLKDSAAHSLQSINRWIHAIGLRDANLQHMGTTFAGLVCAGREAHIFSAGDSRIYRLRGDRLEQLTTDHHAGLGQRHVVTRAVGLEPDLRIDYVPVQVEPFDRYLLCTDGVHQGVSDETLRACLARRAEPEDSAREIVQAALASHIGDNATALILDLANLPRPEFQDFQAALPTGAIAPAPDSGTDVDGFRLDTVLSDGRYVRVFRATDQSSGQEVVLKFPKPLLGAEVPMRDAFLRETWIASRVQSPYVGEILHLEPSRRTRLYLAMPYYAGETLEDRLKHSPRLSLAAGLDIAEKLAKAIAALHRAGIVHRDIKPDNILLLPALKQQGPGLKLIDFSVADFCQSAEASKARAHAPAPGTPSFMAPELFAGKPAGFRSDQFAFGVTLYRMFTGSYPYGEIEPFTHPTFRSRAPLTAHRPDLPAWLDRIIGRAIAVNPDDRYEDVLEFMFELEHGADRASPIVIERKPLYERNPLLFWKIVAGLLAVLLALAVAALLRARTANTMRPAKAAGAFEVLIASVGCAKSPCDALQNWHGAGGDFAHPTALMFQGFPDLGLQRRQGEWDGEIAVDPGQPGGNDAAGVDVRSDHDKWRVCDRRDRTNGVKQLVAVHWLHLPVRYHETVFFTLHLAQGFDAIGGVVDVREPDFSQER
jgi:serine/threonine protein phosphatase PrpC